MPPTVYWFLVNKKLSNSKAVPRSIKVNAWKTGVKTQERSATAPVTITCIGTGPQACNNPDYCYIKYSGNIKKNVYIRAHYNVTLAIPSAKIAITRLTMQLKQKESQ